ncbi:putative arabinose 5-phosphate isomerase [Hibiscus syriacus]|uniref:Arabinose 5-phosphate isomerase n=1 Tax=Hibiscus syriacus TaxID=106335 RepID=A0A6A3AUX9_HIBSY|nr:putative arabinose 5-phosphate isomerase [Hibiscus syriacus]
MLVSLGIRSSFLSPIDALHGDIDAFSFDYILALFSKSSSTEELLHLVPCARAKWGYLISVTSVSKSLSNACDMNVHLPLERELCPFDLAPVASTAIQMVKDVMKKQHELPICKEGDLIIKQLGELSSKGCRCLLVIDDEYHLLGTFTDGDLQRTLDASGETIFQLTVSEICNRNREPSV